MSISRRRLTVGTLASLGLAGALSIGAASAATASDGEVIVRDNGQQCVAVWKNADGSYENWRGQNF